MQEDEIMDVEENISSSSNSSDKDEREQDEGENEEAIEETEENDHDDHDHNSSDGALLELAYQQQEAMEELSNIFRVLNMSPIHDRWAPRLYWTIEERVRLQGPILLQSDVQSISYI